MSICFALFSISVLGDLCFEIWSCWQDVPQFWPLALTLMSQVVTRPFFLPDIIVNVGVDSLAEWLPHFGNLALFGLLSLFATPLRPLTRFLPSRDGYRFRRLMDAWEYGSGSDFKL